MLLQLNISNFALIESLSISFENGFNVLSGETGAGKSILIDAINYVLGVKFTKNSIRTGEKKTFVEAVFSIKNSKTIELLKKLEIDYDDILIISREAFQSGKNITKINGKTVLLTQLRKVSATLMDIHGQHESQTLMNSENHINFLDSFGDGILNKEKEKYRIYYRELKEIEFKIEELSKKTGDKDKIIDFLKYQIDEIEKAKLKDGEDVELEERYSIISNSEAISKILCSSYEKLYTGKEQTLSIFDNLGVVIKELRSIEEHSDEIKSVASSLEESYYNIEENISIIRDIKDKIEFDDKELEYVNNRLYTIDGLKKKYGNTISDIKKYREKIINQYEELVNFSEIIQKLSIDKDTIHIKVVDQAKKIHSTREKIAKTLEQKILDELKYVGLGKSIFNINIEFNEQNINENGGDRVKFFITTNPGEPLRELEKVVSGGELSRIMLAFKTVFVDKDNIPSVIFDEIDTGISGKVAQSVAEKIYAISNNHQVFCITHLPQIACISDVHYLIEKKILNDKTFTFVNRLTLEQKEKAIAKMISGSEITNLTLANAKEMIILADNKKKSLRKIL
ncbi:DNA repair protein RecN [Clostridium pasteurianum DSM 525 = ATCC 6013]|uniref:DNA repair protein RecN n=1 Tax=Clostridium pasteurianum DSM 525 = ATCC 6013 TaxID=1262449 RepID=A0A0H3J244_CLOPA|nr:DNA repair protein RecN [Clostridium pasteurianum]AJA47986.1 DNA repair protein RecN [Clostridium pasteurianum DSM 525 = ATCC 6013]AJA51974.1 DNA repair protein RecN [Clostridium pasteurianum DSM 525 = ATCC 6013]AOZ75271.1 DNA repair protein RecN [Clostridium pasteurianum DSM 525 = ATCC 6013]AOZ79066.1 DNA repair protein RecN [Clostridium pasteurianum]ELP59889.1 DNA repair protein RecN [Clostridium pasteurianum DSM 525 = ATCC 6013]